MADDTLSSKELRQRYLKGGSAPDDQLSSAQIRARYGIAGNPKGSHIPDCVRVVPWLAGAFSSPLRCACRLQHEGVASVLHVDYRRRGRRHRFNCGHHLCAQRSLFLSLYDQGASQLALFQWAQAHGRVATGPLCRLRAQPSHSANIAFYPHRSNAAICITYGVSALTQRATRRGNVQACPLAQLPQLPEQRQPPWQPLQRIKGSGG
jgi:hypothetical protein